MSHKPSAALRHRMEKKPCRACMLRSRSNRRSSPNILSGHFECYMGSFRCNLRQRPGRGLPNSDFLSTVNELAKLIRLSVIRLRRQGIRVESERAQSAVSNKKTRSNSIGGY